MQHLFTDNAEHRYKADVDQAEVGCACDTTTTARATHRSDVSEGQAFHLWQQLDIHNCTALWQVSSAL
jgi:queuine/archaeosine tRNA-ribosyltransferase